MFVSIANAMKTLQIKPLSAQSETEISKALDSLKYHLLEHALWIQPSVRPVVQFAIAYHENHLCVKFKVKELQLKAVFRNTNDPVYRDSCVEIFLAFESDNNYYNLEFNCMGTCLGQYGADRNNRTFISPTLLDRIKASTKISTPSNDELATWELTLEIPFLIFGKAITDLKGSTVRMNFYKCGDDLEEPHFLAWNNIEEEEPNFHLPAYFGSATFV